MVSYQTLHGINLNYTRDLLKHYKVSTQKLHDIKLDTTRYQPKQYMVSTQKRHSIYLNTILYYTILYYTILIRSNEMQQYAGVYLLQNYMFRVSIAPIIRSTLSCKCSFW